MKLDNYYRELVSGERSGVFDRLLLLFLRVVAPLYSLSLSIRSLAYQSGLFRVKRLPLPVVSVGNITLGGTGKTPTVLLIARYLMGQGKKVAVLTRGYGGSLEGKTRIVSDGKSLLLTPAEAGDEPCLLASSLPGLMVVMGSDRYNAGCLALQEMSPDCFVLDDGFQHQRIARDLNILLLDCRAPFGNGRTLPAGFLREPRSAVKRADLIILTRSAGGVLPPELQSPAVPVCRSSHRLAGYMPLSGGDLHPLQELAGQRVLAFSGIADPAAFFDGIEGAGVRLVSTLAFPDHTHYGTKELEALGSLKQQFKADCLVTTAKDAVKLHPYRAIIGRCYVVQLELTLDDPGVLFAALEKIC